MEFGAIGNWYIRRRDAKVAAVQEAELRAARRRRYWSSESDQEFVLNSRPDLMPRIERGDLVLNWNRRSSRTHPVSLPAGKRGRYRVTYSVGGHWDPPLVYLIRYGGSNCYKIGVSSTETRIQAWADHGWGWIFYISMRHCEFSPIAQSPNPATPKQAAFELERRLLAYYRAAGICPAPRTPKRMRTGHTETLDAKKVNAEEICDRAIKELERIEQGLPSLLSNENSLNSREKHQPAAGRLKPRGSIEGTAQSGYKARWQETADGVTTRLSKSGFKTRAEAQAHIDCQPGRARPRGSIRQQANGKYCAVWQDLPTGDGRRRRRSKSGFASVEEAQKFIDAQLDKLL